MASTRVRILFLVGTRPEVVKTAPVLRAAATYPDWEPVLWCTGQQRDLLPAALSTFAIRPELDLDAMRPGDGIATLLGRLLSELEPRMRAEAPAATVVQGDTTSALAGALAAFALGIPVAHVEAGLRSHDLQAPFPEEGNRALIDRVASLHLCPTPGARANLVREGLDGAGVHVTGNTAVDALQTILAGLPADGSPPSNAATLDRFRGARALVLVTGHRREAFAGGLERVAAAVTALARARPATDVVVIEHPNPATAAPWSAEPPPPNLVRVPPLAHDATLWLLRRARLCITDSGGIQEEAPSLGVPLLVTRERTERPEGIAAGCAELVGWDRERIVARAVALVDDDQAHARMQVAENPYGDGQAGRRCAAAIRRRLGLIAEEPSPWG